MARSGDIHRLTDNPLEDGRSTKRYRSRRGERDQAVIARRPLTVSLAPERTIVPELVLKLIRYSFFEIELLNDS